MVSSTYKHDYPLIQDFLSPNEFYILSLFLHKQYPMITSLQQLDLNKRYTYADYLTWQFDEMVELIRGKIFPMSPAPSRFHQEVSSNLHICIGSFLKGKNSKVFSAPFDVRLPLPVNRQKEGKIDTVVQPDLCIDLMEIFLD